jgi:hypothetical protein
MLAHPKAEIDLFRFFWYAFAMAVPPRQAGDFEF